MAAMDILLIMLTTTRATQLHTTAIKMPIKYTQPLIHINIHKDVISITTMAIQDKLRLLVQHVIPTHTTTINQTIKINTEHIVM